MVRPGRCCNLRKAEHERQGSSRRLFIRERDHKKEKREDGDQPPGNRSSRREERGEKGRKRGRRGRQRRMGGGQGPFTREQSEYAQAVLLVAIVEGEIQTHKDRPVQMLEY